ncbi:MAG: phosphatidylethanolamine-binding protein, partial [Myxococcaceae bacterium]|nr:phosphatidylethanolamine-binding protein [Myxococcaceae bacterium]
GEQTSPPLRITAVPAGTESVVLLIEDADSPTPEPLVHAIAWHLPNVDTRLDEGALQKTDAQAPRVPMGKNSFLQEAYLPPDPPPGHGPHRYVFQAFALDTKLAFEVPPGRGLLLEQMRDHVLAKGSLIGTYERSA